MASFDTLEKSVQDSTPIEIYEVTIGSDVYRWTTSEDDVEVDGDTYTATAVSRGAIIADPSDRRAVLVATLPADNEFAMRYVAQAPAAKASVVISRLQRNESPTFDTVQVMYRGSVSNVRFPDNGITAELSLQTGSAMRGRNMPRYTFAGMCGHVLYGPGCDVNPTAFTISGTCSAASGNTITIPGLNAEADGFFDGGFVRTQSTAEPRLILKHVGNVLTLLLPFGTTAVGVAFDALAGCDHVLTSDCALVFDNVLKFGGWAFIPQLNPFSSNPWTGV